MAAGTFLVTQGTSTGIPIDTVGGTTYPISKIDIGNIGSSIPWQGAVTGSLVQTAGTTNTGTVNTGTINTGTINAGTINVGTIDSISQNPPGLWGTSINTSGTAFGTLKAAVSGSSIYITDLIINMAVVSGTVALFNGANTNLLAGSWAFNQNGGLVSNYRVGLQGLSGSALCYQQIGTASLSISAQGFVK